MFWKKKKLADEIFLYESREKRASFRVAPSSDRPIVSSFKGSSVRIRDIGAIGISFPNANLAVGDTDYMAFSLPGESELISIETEIIDIDQKGICHCEFHRITEAIFNAIHRYMLAVQLEQIREEKKAFRRPLPPRLLENVQMQGIRSSEE